MSDIIGRISVPIPPSSGLTFPLISDYPFGLDRSWSVTTHRFGSLATLASQRFTTGSGPRKFKVIRNSLSRTEKASLLNFWNAVQGSYKTFTYNAPNEDRTTTTAFSCLFDLQPLSIRDLATMCQTGLTLVESVNPASAPTYSISSTVTRFPSNTLATALLSQIQEIIPLIHIKVRDTAVPDIYLSDRRCTVGSHTYLPRLLDIGDPGSDVLLSQSISGEADQVRFTFGNADRAMSLFTQDTSLYLADIDLCLYHVNSGILLQLWKGAVVDWQLSGGNTFPITCSDSLYYVTQQYPRRTITRECWKTFNDGVECPYAAQGSGGDPSKCDFFYNTSNGCLAHGMSKFFGGQPSFPQSVVIKDNGTGVIGGFGRDVVTSVSIFSDSMWGKPLADIWCNDGGDPGKAFWANCIVAAVRDESDFEDVLGIVGAGPISAYEGMSVQTNADGYKFIVAPLADGFPPHGFKVDSQLRITGYQPTLGLREVPGNDPVNPGTTLFTAADQFSLGQGTPQHWEVPDPTFSNISGVVHRIFPYSAGTAFVEIRYSKSSGSGINPTIADSHTMVVPIKQGLAGWTFNAGGTRTSVPGLTNPFWVAVNTFFRALGIFNADATTQLNQILLPSIIKGDGSGCAEIADLMVAPVFGDPLALETQFQFQGMLAEFKPFRDWLREILSCALGYFTFEFGKLRLGIRENASATSAFTLGNMLYQSLSLHPAKAEFEYLKIDFANVALQYQNDTADYQDKDHAAHFGRAGAPLSSRQRCVGVPSMSQGLRIAVTRTREEIGGILRPDQSNPYVEWDNNNEVTFKTTILALDTAVGQVTSVTHPDLPTYPGPVGGSPLATNTWKYRITKWSLHRDYSITIQGRSVTDSMYDLDVGPKPADVQAPPLPILFFAQPLGQWTPFQIQAASNDALYPSEWTFDASQQYSTLANGTPLAQAVVTGKLPVDSFIPSCGAPDVKSGDLAVVSTGGSIPGNTAWYLQVCAVDAAGRYSPPSDVLVVHIPTGTNTNSVTLSDILWPSASGLTGYVVFVSDQTDLVCGQQTGTLSGSAGAHTPTAITIPGPFSRSTYAVPNVSQTMLRVRAKRLIHGGLIGAPIVSISSTTITASDTVDVTGTDNWTGRVLAVIGRLAGTAPFAHFNITGFDHATGVFTLDRDPVAAGVLVGDTIVVCTLGYDNSATPTVLTDAGFSNATNSHTGESVNDPNRIGNYVLVIKGTNRGATAKIISNTSTSYTLDRSLVIDATSVWIVVSAVWDDVKDTTVDNADPLKSTQIALDVSNYRRLPILLSSVIVDVNGGVTEETNAVVRMLYVGGAGGTRTTNVSDTQLATDGLVLVNTSGATQPSPTTLAAAITTTTSPTTLSLVDGSHTVNGTDLLCDGERMRIESGSGTNNPIVIRGAYGTTAATHLINAAVTLPGVLTFQCLVSSIVPNVALKVKKATSDINYVEVFAGGSDTFDNGSTAKILADDTDAAGLADLVFPG